MKNKGFKPAIICNGSKESKLVHDYLTDKYDIYPVDKANILVVIGGDGSMLHAIHKYMEYDLSFYGINAGSIGFLMNEFKNENLLDKLKYAHVTELYPLTMEVTQVDNKISKALAINEVSIFRATNQAAKFKIYIDNIERMIMSSDGILVSTPAGSSAYNLSAGGTIVPINSKALCLTPICSFRPRRWSGAILPSSAEIKFEILDYKKRPVNAVADYNELRDIKEVTIRSNNDKKIKLLFDSTQTFEDRVIKEQFSF